VQTFYQPLFSNSPFAVHFPSAILFPFKASHNKKPKAKAQSKNPKAKSLVSSLSESFISSGKQGGAVVLGAEHDFITEEIWIPASLNVNNLEAAVLHFASFVAWAVPILAYR
jgi:hypothetical protein